MADKRKLQSDIERNLKRVQEGRSAFQEILDKFESSSNSTQKEKFEGDLKKEIKKLQRLRDQIKTWLTASEVKDKRPLLDARREIEQDMERFKIIEKETKTKAYSKEGLLSVEAKKDPQQREKEDINEWLKQCISSFNTQTEKYEFEIESLANNNNKKKRIDKETLSLIEEKRQHLETCCFHVEKLETIMRLLDNERLDCTKVRTIQESVEYLIDGADEQSLCDFKNLYDDLKLDELGDSTGITATSGALVPGQDHDLNGVIPTSLGNRSGCDDTGSSTSTHTTMSNCTDSSLTHPGSSTSSNASSRERAKSDEKAATCCSSVSTTNTPVKSSLPNLTNKSKTSNTTNHLQSPTLISHIVAGTPNKSNGKSQPAINGPTISLYDTNNLRYAAPIIDSHLQSTEHNQKYELNQKQLERTIATTVIPVSTCYSQTRITNPKDDSCNPMPISAPVSTNGTMSTSYRDDVSAPTQSTLASCTDSGVQNQFLELTTYTSGITNIYANASIPTTVNDLSEANSQTPPSLFTTAMLAASQDKQLSSLLAVSQHTSNLLRGSQTNMHLDSVPLVLSLANKHHSAPSGNPLSISATNNQAQSSYVTLDNHLSNIQSSIHSQQSKTLLDSPVHAHMHPRDAAAPFRNRNLDKPKGAVPPELLSQLQALESGYHRLPHPCDTEKARMLICKNPVNCPSYYPREPLPNTDNEEYYMKLDAQTLFFIFYYFEGTKAQYFAAKALKRMSWRFHTKYMMWFQRHEEPKQITDEYESGSYIYYDFRTMRQRKKEEFIFHYSFLEDKDF